MKFFISFVFTILFLQNLSGQTHLQGYVTDPEGEAWKTLIFWCIYRVARLWLLLL